MVSKKEMLGLFEPAKNKRLARIISIETPAKFRASIKTLSKDGTTLKEFRALNLAKTRAKLQLKRPNLSAKERREFTAISKMRLPKVTVKSMVKKSKKLTGFSIYTGKRKLF